MQADPISSGTGNAGAAGSDEVVCTLFEGHYHLGAAVLINSLLQNGFRGLVWAGYRGELPPWVAQFSQRGDGLYQVGDALLGLEALTTSRHFTQYKPEFLESLFARGIARKRLWYFDPDITVRCEWSFYQRWVRHGVCLCQEITMGQMSSDHPLRCEWVEAASQAGWPAPARTLNQYFNGGFAGLSIEHRGFVRLWRDAIQLAIDNGMDERVLQHGTRADTFYSTDQDALNIAATYSDAPLTTIGPEGMGFLTGGFTMYHSVGGQKPWRKSFLLRSLLADLPANADKHLWANADGPIQPFSRTVLKRKHLALRVAAMIGRFYRRA